MDKNLKIMLVSEANHLKEQVVNFINMHWRAYHHCPEYIGRLITADPDLAAFAMLEEKVVGIKFIIEYINFICTRGGPKVTGLFQYLKMPMK